MIQLEQIKAFFPPILRDHAAHQKYIIKEYLQLLILDFLSGTSFVRKIVFIGGTNLRLTKGIDRFSEDLDFDCKNLSDKEFMEMTDAVLVFLRRSGWHVEPRDKPNLKLNAYRRNIYFPELLFEMGLSGHREERFLIKIESEDQLIDYKPIMTKIKGCGFYFSFPVPEDGVLCAMKISALLSRQKGRDFYDAMFLLGQTSPDYSFLSTRCGILDLKELKEAIATMLTIVKLNQKARDFEHLLFQKTNSQRILAFAEFIDGL